VDEVRVFRVGAGGWVIALRGFVDRGTARAAAAEIDRCGGDAVIVDLLRAEVPDHSVLVGLLRPSTTFVAERPLAESLERAHVRVVPTLAAALG
jgi:hypothetical protein